MLKILMYAYFYDLFFTKKANIALKNGIISIIIKIKGGEFMNLKTIHHIAIIVSNYEKSKDFYVNKLGFEIIRENYREEKGDYKLDLKLGDCELEIFSGKNNPKRLSYPEACGLRHLAFKVDNIEEVVSQLNEMGIETEPIRIDTITNKKMTFFADPDNLPLELHE